MTISPPSEGVRQRIRALHDEITTLEAGGTGPVADGAGVQSAHSDPLASLDGGADTRSTEVVQPPVAPPGVAAPVQPPAPVTPPVLTVRARRSWKVWPAIGIATVFAAGVFTLRVSSLATSTADSTGPNQSGIELRDVARSDETLDFTISSSIGASTDLVVWAENEGVESCHRLVYARAHSSQSASYHCPGLGAGPTTLYFELADGSSRSADATRLYIDDQ